MSVLLPVKVMLNPVDGVASAVEGRHWALPMVALALLVSVSGAALALRLDPGPKVLSKMAQAGELARASENEIQESIRQAGRISLVVGVAKGVATPLLLLAISLALMLSGWLLGAQAPFAKYFSAAAVALLPIALYHLIYALSAFRQYGLTEELAKSLVPSNLLALRPDAPPKLARALGAVDFFSLWSAALLGLGFSQATGAGKGRSLVVGFTLYAMYAAVFLIGLPGFFGGPPR